MMPVWGTGCKGDIDKKVPVTEGPENGKLFKPTHRPVGVDFYLTGRLYRIVDFVSRAHKGTVLMNVRDQGRGEKRRPAIDGKNKVGAGACLSELPDFFTRDLK